MHCFWKSKLRLASVSHATTCLRVLVLVPVLDHHRAHDQRLDQTQQRPDLVVDDPEVRVLQTQHVEHVLQAPGAQPVQTQVLAQEARRLGLRLRLLLGFPVRPAQMVLVVDEVGGLAQEHRSQELVFVFLVGALRYRCRFFGRQFFFTRKKCEGFGQFGPSLVGRGRPRFLQLLEVLLQLLAQPLEVAVRLRRPLSPVLQSSRVTPLTTSFFAGTSSTPPSA